MIDRDAIIRFLLGEAEGTERDALARLIATSPEAAGIARELRTTLSSLTSARSEHADFHVPAEARAALYDQAPTPRPSVLGRMAGAVSARIASLVHDSWRAGMTPAGIRGDDGSRRMAFEADDLRVELRFEPSATRLSSWECVGRVDAPAGSSVVWREIDANEHHVSMLDPDGFFEFSIGPGRHQLELRAGDRVVLCPVLRHPGGDVPA